MAHKDVGLPQVWPRPPMDVLTPPRERFHIIANRSFLLISLRCIPLREEAFSGC